MFKLSFDRALSGRGLRPLAYLFIIIIGFIALATILVCVFLKPASGADALYRVITVFIDPGSVWTVRDFSVIPFNEAPQEQTPHWYSLFITIIGLILFIGVFISILSNMFERRVDRYRNGQISYRVKDHVVVIGFNDLVPMLIKQLVTSSKYDGSYILIQSSVPTEDVRRKIFSELSTEERERILFLYARRDSKEELQKLYTHAAREVFILGDIDEDERDSNNIDCLSQLVDIHEDQGASRKVPFNVLFQSRATYAAFQITDLGVKWRKFIEFHPFNFYEEWARRVFVTRKWGAGSDGRPLLEYPRVDRELMLKEDERHLHLAIVGLNDMGHALGIEAAHLLHFSNAFDGKGRVIPDRKTVITFIDEEAEEKMKKFRNQYRHFFQLSSCRYYEIEDGQLKETVMPPTNEQGLAQENLDFLDVEFQFIQASPSDAAIQDYVCRCAEHKQQQLTLFSCMEDPTDALAWAMYLPDVVYQQEIPIFVRQAHSSALLRSLGCCEMPEEKGVYRRYAHVYPFGMLDCSFNLDDTTILMAQEVSYLYEVGASIDQCGAMPSPDELEKKWYESGVSLQWSNMYTTYSFGFKMHSLGITNCSNFTITEEQVDELAPVEHARWNMEKLLLGYKQASMSELETILQGGKSIKKEYKKRYIHTLIVPFDQLSEGDIAYDRNIMRSIPALLNKYGRNNI